MNHDVSRTVRRGLQDVSHAGMPAVSVMLLKRQVSAVYFILTESMRAQSVGRSDEIGYMTSVESLLTQEPIEIVLRGVVAIRWQTGRARAFAGEARVHLPPGVGIVVAIVVTGQVCAEGEAASAG